MTLVKVVDIDDSEIYINVAHIVSIYRSKFGSKEWIITLLNKTVVTNHLPQYIEDRL